MQIYRKMMILAIALMTFIGIRTTVYAEGCGATLKYEYSVQDGPEDEPVNTNIIIPKDWAKKARFCIKFQIPDEDMVNVLARIAEKNVIGDGLDQSKHAVDLLFRFALFDNGAAKILAKLDGELNSPNINSRDKLLGAYIEYRYSINRGERPH